MLKKSIIIIAVLLGISGYTYYFWQKQSTPIINSYESCVAAQDSLIQESYPAVCVTKSGAHFTQTIASPLPTPSPTHGIPTTTLYVCPATGYVDCMPILDAAGQKACSPEAMAWYKANCPNFQGGAL